MPERAYRYEHAKTGRAACQNTVCKNGGPKIQKGELRMGSFVDYGDFQGFKWKHWGCVTPAQIANVQKDIEGLDIDDDEDMNVLDGFDELDDEAREKVRQALKDGHVADEDWKGDPEKNRPGQKGINSARKKKKTLDAENPDEKRQTDDTPVKPKKGKKGKKAAAATEETEKNELADREETPVPAPKKRGKKAQKEEPKESAEEVVPAKKKRAAPKKRNAEADEDVKAEDEAVSEPPKKKARVKKEIVKKEESNEEIMAEDNVVAKEPPKQKGRAKKVKTEVANSDQAMPDATDMPETSAVKKEEAPEDDPGLADVQDTKATKGSRSKTTKAPADADVKMEDIPEAKPAKKSRSKNAKEEPAEDEQDDELEHQPGVLTSAKPAARGRSKKANSKKEVEAKEERVSEDELAGSMQNGENVEMTEEVLEKSQPKKGKKGAKSKAR